MELILIGFGIIVEGKTRLTSGYFIYNYNRIRW